MEYFGDTNIIPFNPEPTKQEAKTELRRVRAPIEFKLRVLSSTPLTQSQNLAEPDSLSDSDRIKIEQIEEELRTWGEGYGYDAETVAWRFATRSRDDDALTYIRSRQLSYNT